MSRTSKIATAMAVATVGLGLGATSASAYRIDGISANPFHYTGTTTTDHSFTVGAMYTITCPAALTWFSGTATGSATTSFTPFYGGTDACEFFGVPATASTSGAWNAEVTGGFGPGYTGEIRIPNGTTTTLSIPLAGCSLTVSGPQTFAHGTGSNTMTALNLTGKVELQAFATGVAYTATGCPFSSGSGGEHSTNGPVTIPGIVIS